MTVFSILSLDWSSFEGVCRHLRSMVDDSGFHPDIVVCVPRAGYYLVEKGWADCDSMPIKIIKPSADSFVPYGFLKRIFGRLVRFLPLYVRDRLRIWDAKRRIKQGRRITDIKVELPVIPESVERVLIVDDAVDSGITLAAVIAAFKRMKSHIIIRSAVITVTGNKPLCMPDYFLYNNSILVRMPWSIDV